MTYKPFASTKHPAAFQKMLVDAQQPPVVLFSCILRLLLRGEAIALTCLVQHLMQCGAGPCLCLEVLLKS